MTFVREAIRWEAVAGEPLAASGAVLVPESRVLRVRLPFGAAVWQWPTAVRVEGPDRSARVPIRDVTRALQLALLGACLASLLAAGATARQDRGEKP